MNKICGIYKITSPTGKIYIGQSKDIYKRINYYKNYRCKGQLILYGSLCKYGWNTHNFEIICECDINELNDLEKYYIKKYDTFNTEFGMNLTSGGEHHKLSDKSIDKIRNIHLGRKCSIITKLKMSNAHKGKKHTKEHNINQGNSLRGIKRSEETKLKISAASKGSKRSDEFKLKVSKSLTGIKRSDEFKKKLSIIKKGNKNMLNKKHSEETKEKIREKRKLQIFSEESKQKMSESHKRKKLI